MDGVGGKITQSTGIVIVPLKLVHSGVVKLVCCIVIDFHKVIDILFGLDFQFTHSCVFDPSNFRVYDRLAQEDIRFDYIGKVEACLTVAPIHFLSLCDGIATPYEMAMAVEYSISIILGRHQNSEYYTCTSTILKNTRKILRKCFRGTRNIIYNNCYQT